MCLAPEVGQCGSSEACCRLAAPTWRIANRPKDFLNKLAYPLILNWDRIALEDLPVKNMVCNHHLAKSILDSGWSHPKRNLVHLCWLHSSSERISAKNLWRDTPWATT
jgi:hypothetical protein